MGSGIMATLGLDIMVMPRLLGWHWCLGRLGGHDWCARNVTHARGVLEVGSHAGWVGSVGWHTWTGSSSSHSGHVHGHRHWTGSHWTT